ncbi:hypothetical protein TNIN_15661 [Trichonephila inaurata madagascariensis]|uniref:Uncharacterized protein n=1 Tax=Trichonephila inaurata madagascariensis TaxID=2747483 RepID=A0A8X7CSJ4_9ARAC|nr:hypothetical protein TNIN_15661 [Trichonephila inaurata madagascariensis]
MQQPRSIVQEEEGYQYLTSLSQKLTPWSLETMHDISCVTILSIATAVTLPEFKDELRELVMSSLSSQNILKVTVRC